MSSSNRSNHLIVGMSDKTEYFYHINSDGDHLLLLADEINPRIFITNTILSIANITLETNASRIMHEVDDYFCEKHYKERINSKIIKHFLKILVEKFLIPDKLINKLTQAIEKQYKAIMRNGDLPSDKVLLAYKGYLQGMFVAEIARNKNASPAMQWRSFLEQTEACMLYGEYCFDGRMPSFKNFKLFELSPKVIKKGILFFRKRVDAIEGYDFRPAKIPAQRVPPAEYTKSSPPENPNRLPQGIRFITLSYPFTEEKKSNNPEVTAKSVQALSSQLINVQLNPQKNAVTPNPIVLPDPKVPIVASAPLSAMEAPPPSYQEAKRTSAIDLAVLNKGAMISATSSFPTPTKEEYKTPGTTPLITNSVFPPQPSAPPESSIQYQANNNLHSGENNSQTKNENTDKGDSCCRKICAIM